jgi:2-polyprenyl-3-methyl-5-hydroxy-6-metoxy-1,4-benzoquinol methylase
MNLHDLIDRERPPQPWAEGEKIPWNDPDFSARMLREHLTQDHDMASRRQAVIDRHVAWIHNTCLHGSPGRVLDLGCGPGFYSQRLARLGHDCVGIDFGPASIDHARSEASRTGLEIEYTFGDIRKTDFGSGFDLAMLVFGEFNVFTVSDARQLLARMRAALKPGGRVLLEPHTFAAIENEGRAPPSWATAASGLFSPKPHCRLEEHFWHGDRQAATTRHYIIDAETGEVTRCAATMQAYTDEGYDELFRDAGFFMMRRFPSLSGGEADRHNALFVLVATKPDLETG